MDNIDDLIWNIFLDDLKDWKETYLKLSKFAQNQLFALLTLKAITNSKKDIILNSSTYDEEQKTYFKEFLSELTLYFNPDIYLRNLENTLVCLKFSPKSHLYERFGDKEICGKYLGLIESHVTRIKNNQDEYVEEDCSIAFKFGYPKTADVIEVAIIDLKTMEEL
jgi:hypothetical protein